ncbi:uncharacterized protein TNCV_1932981 [Trichonephila clavipes]|nr:uncharacterized protein TNCV_1932981 [Trichonephila clavipes]
MGKKYLLTIAIPDYRPSIENVGLSSPVQHDASPDKNSSTTVMVSFLDVTGIKPGPSFSPNQNTLRIASGTEPTLIRKEDMTPLSVVQFLCSLHHCKRWRRWSTFNGRQRSGRRANMALCEGVWPQMIYRSSPAVVVLGRPPPTFLTAVSVVWNDFQARETTLLLIPNSAATLVTVQSLLHLSDHSSTCEVVQIFEPYIQSRNSETVTHSKGLSLNEIANLLRELSENESDGGELF